MLILSRRPNESLRIGNNVVVTVVGFNGNQIRLGISAPPNVVIDREEVHLRKIAEQIPTLSPVATTLNPVEATLNPLASPAVQPPRVRTARRKPEARRQSRLQAE
jgi:carbon storage regulator